MSSILKALKKIDETAGSADNGRPWPQPAAREAIARNTRNRRLVRQWTTYTLVAACLISLAVLLYLRQSERAPQRQTEATIPSTAGKTGPVHRANIEQPAPPGSQPDTADRTERTEIRSETVARPTPSARITEPDMRREPAETVARNHSESDPAPKPRKPLPKKSKKAETKVNTQAVRTNDQATTASTPATPPATASSTDQTPQYDRLQNSDLVIQAIAWSPEPSKRIAVINGSIVREGESVGEFTLVRIRPDDLVVNDGSKNWQLAFGLQH